MTTGDIQALWSDVYRQETSRDLVSRVTDAVHNEMKAWQDRPPSPIYPVILIDPIVMNVSDGQVGDRPDYVAMGIHLDGHGDVLGMCVGPTGGEGAKPWMNMLTELKNRGVQDVLLVYCNGLKGLPESIVATCPHATLQTCVMRMVRDSLRFASRKY